MRFIRFFALIILFAGAWGGDAAAQRARRDGRPQRDTLQCDTSGRDTLRPGACDSVSDAVSMRIGQRAADYINRQHFGPDARVGLVLAGGGAKGLYHIGVIRALEENGIPIDYISGTSMGAIVAALYASGYSPEQMVSIVASGDVEQWVSGRIDDKYRFYYTERSDAPTMLSIYADMKRDSVSNKNSMSLALPHAFINTAQIDLALTGLFAHWSGEIRTAKKTCSYRRPNVFPTLTPATILSAETPLGG